MVDKNIHTLGKMEIVRVPILDIEPNEYNPNRQSDHEFELLCRSIEEDGFTQPIIVQSPTASYQPGRIVDGEHRWRALQALGKTMAPVIYVDFTEEQMKVSTLRHNRARGSEDIQMASGVLRELQDLNAIDWAADSLMLDNIELEVMLEDIPGGDLSGSRHEGMDFEEIEQQLAEEKEMRQVKSAEQQEMKAEGRKRFTLTMNFRWDEAKVVKAVIGRNKAEGIQALCEAYLASGGQPLD